MPDWCSGTDAPTAPYAPLPNLFIATTRRSALEPSLPPNEPKNALPLAGRPHLRHRATPRGRCFAEDRLGSIAPGRHADFVVVDPDVTDVDPERLLDAAVLQTVVGLAGTVSPAGMIGPVSDLIDTTEMYLRTIFELEEEGIVPLRARIAERLQQSGPTVSQTVGADGARRAAHRRG